MSKPVRISLAKLEALEVHPFAELFPFAKDDEIEGIAARMADHGFREDRPIILHDGKILDGRNRRKALALAIELKGRSISAWVKKYDGPLEPLDFVLSENMDRRHLDESQRAIVAANLANWAKGMNQHSEGSAQVPTQAKAAKMLNVSERSIRYAKQIISKSDELAAAVSGGHLKVRQAADLIKAGDKELLKFLALKDNDTLAAARHIRDTRQRIGRELKTDRINEIAAKGSGQLPDLPRNQFPVLVADCPWLNAVWDEETGSEKSPPYPTMTNEEIMNLCAGERSPALDDAILFFWTTANRIGLAIDVIRAWGFEQVSAMFWNKELMGTGRYARDVVEILLICKRGKIHAPKPEDLERSLYSEKRGAHSKKPVRFSEIIDKQYPDLPKLELFQRAQSLEKGDIRLHECEKGRWSFWGFEAGVEHEGEVK